MDYIKINDYKIPFPNGFTMEPEDNIVNEVTVMSGDTQADVNGWKYKEQTFEWDYLKEEELNRLISETDPIHGTFAFSFYEPGTNGYKTINAMRKGRVYVKTRYKDAGKIVWTGIKVKLSFPNCYGG